jgi:hypothetical protein
LRIDLALILKREFLKKLKAFERWNVNNFLGTQSGSKLNDNFVFLS